MTHDLKIVTVPRDLYYHEVAYVRGLENERDQLLTPLRKGVPRPYRQQ